MPIAYTPIGRTRHDGASQVIEIDPIYRPGLIGLDTFSHINVIWHADRDELPSEAPLVLPAPYRGAPDQLGLFATRTPIRPNSVCLSVAPLAGVDVDAGLVRLFWIDCEDDTPVLDIKPYHPSSDRVEAPKMPDWCANWPKSLETSDRFDWDSVFIF